jgi:hypothetical protein
VLALPVGTHTAFPCSLNSGMFVKKRTTYAGEEREIREITVIQQAGLVLRYAIADLSAGRDLRRATLERSDLVEL